MILATLIKNEIASRGISHRAAAREAGISQTTIIKMAKGGPADIDTIVKVCAWLKVDPSDVIDGLKQGDDQLVKNLALLIRRQPKLAQVFTNLLGQFLAGDMTQEEVLDVVNYASYKLSMRRDNAEIQQQDIGIHEESGYRA
jgi:DNA-binding Xre family transcriptional regulator